MDDAFKLQVAHAVEDGDVDAVLALIEHQYEFRCPAFVMGGPGHQSKHNCDYRRPHPIDGEHHASTGYDWEGTAEFKDGKLYNNPQAF